MKVRSCTIKANTTHFRIKTGAKRDGFHPSAQSAAACPIGGVIELVIDIKAFLISS